MRLLKTSTCFLLLSLFCSSCVYLGRVSTSATGGQLNGGSSVLDVSADGRYILMESSAQIASGVDTNTVQDIYRKDTLTGAVDLVSVSHLGTAADGRSLDGEISDDGRWVAFDSLAENLVAGDTNETQDIYLRDMVNGVTTLVSAGSEDQSIHPAISGDGNVVAFVSSHDFVPTGTGNRVWAYTHAGGSYRLVSSDGNGVPGVGLRPSVDFTGETIAFDTGSQLVPTDTDAFIDIYVKLLIGATVRVTETGGVAPNGGSSNASLANDGRAVAFESRATNFVAGDGNGEIDIYVATAAGTVERASVTTAGGEGSLESVDPRISGNGQVVSFVTESVELNGGNPGVPAAIVRDRETATTHIGAQDSSGSPVEVRSPGRHAPLSADGHYVAFTSPDQATPDDTNSSWDVFLRWWSEMTVTSISPASISLGANQPVTITGTGFRDVTTNPFTTIGAVDGITFTNVVVVDDTTITADVESVVGITPLGPRRMWLEQQGTGPGTSTGALESCACLTVAL